MSDEDNEVTNKLKKNLAKAYNKDKSYKFKVNEGKYWQIVERAKEIQELVKQKNKT